MILYINEINNYFFKKLNMETIQNLDIENALNTMLVKLDNFDLEYKKLFDIWKVELKLLLSKEKERIDKKILERIQNIHPYSKHIEDISLNINFDEKIQYRNWYNQALEDVDDRIKNFINLNFIYITE